MKYAPQKVTDLDIAFGGRAMDLLPPWDQIPKEFKTFRGNTWAELASDWFFNGLDSATVFSPRDAIDGKVALRHLTACLRSWEPKHEHKEAGVAYLASLWFTSVKAPGKTYGTAA